MGKNKIKISKETKINELKPKILLTKQQKVHNLVNKMNEFMYESLQSGNLKINDPQIAAKNLIRRSNKNLFTQILNGEVLINQTNVPFKLSKKRFNQFLDDEYENDKKHVKITTNNFLQIENVNKNLKIMHQNLQRQKQLQKNHQKVLEEKARQFVVKVQKQKEQFEEKLKNKKSRSRLIVRAYSEDTIRSMNQRLQQRIRLKKQQLNNKIQNIQKRKVERVKEQVNNEVQYWQKVKKYESLKHLSAHNEKQPGFLPQINVTKSHSQRYPVQNTKKRRYSTNEADKLSNNILKKKFENIDQYVLKAKLKLQSFQNKQKVQSTERKIDLLTPSQLFKDIYISNKNKMLLNPQKSEFTILDHQKPKKLTDSSHIQNPQGNYLEKSLKIKRQNSLKKGDYLKKFHQKHQESENLQIYASIIKPSRNFVLSSLQTSWNQTLNKIKLHEVDKIRGLNNLAAIEKRLDKIDKEGIVKRLKLKAQTIDEMENNNELMTFNEKKIFIKTNENKAFGSKNQKIPQADLITPQRVESTESLTLAQSENEFILNEEIKSF